MTDDLRARIAEALCPPHHRVGSVSSGQPLTPLRPCHLHQAQAETVMAVVTPELERRDRRIEEYRDSRERWMAAAYADRRASESVGEQLRAALTALQAVREAQSLGEALAAVAKHDDLTRDLVAQPTADPQPVSPEFFAELKKATARESDDLHDWYAAMDDQPTTKE